MRQAGRCPQRSVVAANLQLRVELMCAGNNWAGRAVAALPVSAAQKLYHIYNTLRALIRTPFLGGRRPLRATALPAIAASIHHRAFCSPVSAAQSLIARLVLPATRPQYAIARLVLPANFAHSGERIPLFKFSIPGTADITSSLDNRTLFPFFRKGHSQHSKNRPACWDTHIGHK